MPNKHQDPRRKTGSDRHPPNSAGTRLRQYWRPVLVLVAVIAAVAWWNPNETAQPPAADGLRKDRQFALGPGALPGAAAASVEPQERERQLAQLKSHLQLVERTLCSYQDGTKYPQESRPISEHPDQVYPNRPIEQATPMRTSDGKADPSVQIKMSQSRVYMASGETVLFTLAATDSSGKSLPLFVTRAVANGMPGVSGAPGPQIALPFADDGGNGDAVAGDGIVSGLLVPGATGFANFNGTIRADVKYNVGDRAGVAAFDVIYTSETPATWGATIREAVEDGSLNLYLKADIRQAGRYLVNGRVDDAKGKPFALVSFNDMLPTGPTEIKLTVFGKLLRDQAPAFPLTLRDVDAYLLKEKTDPDRAMMARRGGATFVTKMHDPAKFSDTEWQSEQRSRYLKELGKDVGLAQEALGQFDASLAGKPFAGSDCARVLGSKT